MTCFFSGCKALLDLVSGMRDETTYSLSFDCFQSWSFSLAIALGRTKKDLFWWAHYHGDCQKMSLTPPRCGGLHLSEVTKILKIIVSKEKKERMKRDIKRRKQSINCFASYCRSLNIIFFLLKMQHIEKKKTDGMTTIYMLDHFRYVHRPWLTGCFVFLIV